MSILVLSMKKIIFVLLFVLPFLAQSQPYIVEWIQRFNSPPGFNEPPFEQPNSMMVDTAGNAYITGFVVRDTAILSYNTDILTVKYNKEGNLKWYAIYDSPYQMDDEGVKVVADDSGNVYVTGYSFGTGTEKDIITIKYDPYGLLKWVQRYNGAANDDDEGKSVGVDANGNVYVGGYYSPTVNNHDFIIVKYDLNGNFIWQRIHASTAGPDEARDLVVGPNNFIYATGTGFFSNHADYLTAKYDPAGNMIWDDYNDGGSNQWDFAEVMVVDSNSNCFISGSTSIAGQNKMTTVKYDAAGNEDWSINYTGYQGNTPYPYDIATDNNGKAFVCGNDAGDATFKEYLAVTYNSTGTQQWASVLDSTGNDDNAYAIATDMNGDVYCTGKFHINDENMVTIKYSSTGVRKWTYVYSFAGGADCGYDIHVNNNLEVYITGKSNSDDTIAGVDMVTIKLSQPQTKPSVGELENDFYMNVFPNPSSGKFMVESEKSIEKFTLYNALGEIVFTIQPRSTFFRVNAEHFPPGVYYYQAQSDERIRSGKVVVER